MQTHYLKTWPEYFEDLKAGIKTFEVRYNDRKFAVEDIVILQNYNLDTKEYSGEQLYFKIKYIVNWNDNIITEMALKVGYSILGLEPHNI